uniref:phosphatidylinositol-3,5-bisphosphate 3-phosphatase n=1 Tax=Meloidogyne incognita TaxID=6306 RepID=A0A914KTS3_MELIC
MNSYIKNVQLIGSGECDSNNTIGTLHVLGTHLVFKSDSSKKEIWVVHTLIGSVTRSPSSINGSQLSIRYKHFLVLLFLIPKDKDCQLIYETLTRCSKLGNINELFAFSIKNDRDGTSAPPWNYLNWDEEFARQGVSNEWKESNFNSNYSYCDTYPEKLWLPEKASTQMLIGSCRFRSRARLPVLTFFYKHNSATICRSSQPLSGFSARCLEDECLIELIMSANPSSSTLYLIDTRPRVNAMVNKVQGKGFEDSKNYTNIQFHFFDIENIHVVRSSLNRLLEACQRPQSITQYLKAVDASGWLKHLRVLLECSFFIAESVIRGISCVVHCSDGWDRTSQTVSLAQLLLDPYYRTINGFQTLIDKDWLGFGFKFDDRCGHLGTLSEENEKEVSPIFTQFLDSIYQLMRHKPMAFEFNERYLIELNENAYSCVYGQFIGNCDKDRKDLRITTKTLSLWSFMDSRKDDYTNPFYNPAADLCLHEGKLQPSSFVVWSNMYNQFDISLHPKEYFPDLANEVKQHRSLLNELNEIKELNISASNYTPIWQSQLGVDDCSNPNCGKEFISRLERRLHCYFCGKIFCKKCCNKIGENESSKELTNSPIIMFACNESLLNLQGCLTLCDSQQCSTLQSYLDAVRKSLEAALCIRQFGSQVVERHNKPEVEIRTSKEVLLCPITISRNKQERVFIEPSINSVRISIGVKQADEIEKILCNKFSKFMCQRADNFIILRRKPLPGYDISFLITATHSEVMYKQKLIDFLIHFMQEIDKEISEMKLALNARARTSAEEFLKRFN